MSSLVIGIAGTAKNTGKTTTTYTLMNEVRYNSNLTLGLTSIGYDGEDIDNITGLPKPRIHVWPGVLIAVSENCLKNSSAQVEILENTTVKTPLGTVVIGRVKKQGRLVIAGPNKSKDLAEILTLLKKYNSDLIIVDGALNRIAPMIEVDGIILTTGAAKNHNINELALETKKIVEIFNYPVLQSDTPQMLYDCILDFKGAEKLLEDYKNNDTASIQGVMGEQSFRYLVDKCKYLTGKRLIFSDTIKLLVTGEINNIYDILTKLRKENFEIGVKRTVNIIAVTINPYYPKYRFSNDNYQEAYVDKDELYMKFREELSVKVYDVVREGAEELFQDILEYWNYAKNLAGK